MVSENGGVESAAIREFFDRKGAVGLLCVIDPSGSQFSRLVEAVDVSRATVASRLDEGETLGVFHQNERDAYVLSTVGVRLRFYLDRHGLTERYRVINELQSSFDQGVGELQEWVVSNEEFLYSETEEQMLADYFSGSLEE